MPVAVTTRGLNRLGSLWMGATLTLFAREDAENTRVSGELPLSQALRVFGLVARSRVQHGTVTSCEHA
ncbi:MAG: hypothetical protein AAF460_08915 [Pseudomonadota bacterium]